MDSTSHGSNRPASHRAADVASLALFSWGAFWLVAWLMIAFTTTDTAMWQKDWFCIWQTGHDLVQGARGGLYTTDYSDASGYFWLYPPYALYPAAALSLLPPRLAYGAVILTTMGLVLVSLRLHLPLATRSGGDRVVAAAILGSAAFNGVVVTGQNSGWWLFFLATGLWAEQAGRPLLAGLLFAGLGFKPNWVAWVVLWLLVTRRWRVLGVVAASGVALVVASLPLGVELWSDFLVSSRGLGQLIFETYPVHRLIALHATCRSLLPAAWVTPVWGLGELAMLGCAGFVWVRSKDPARQVAMLTLMVVAANVYANFYDALVLALPLAIWWTHRDEYPAPHRWAVAGLAAAIWAWPWLSLYGFVDDPPALVGGLIALWIGVEAHAIASAPRAGAS